MLEVCDEVRVTTRKEWIPIVQNMGMEVGIVEREPSSMSDAILFAVGEHSETVVVGMPDTYILNCTANIYEEMIKQREADVVIGAWTCEEELKGRVGQIQIDGDRVVAVEDKAKDCDYPDMWGTMLFRNGMARRLNPEFDHLGKELDGWIKGGIEIRAVRLGGRYVDAGTIDGLKFLYRELSETE